jgi:DNA-directed RNA polymerase subunit RPC12/RpoP
MIGLGILMLSGRWWPGILVLIGLSLVIGALTRESRPPFFDQPEVPTASPLDPAPPPAPARSQPINPPAPAEPGYRFDLLPSNCSQCGGPVRSHDVKWLGPKSAACPYCGSPLSMKKS